MAWNSNLIFRCSMLEAVSSIPALAAGKPGEGGLPQAEIGTDRPRLTERLKAIIIEDELFIAWIVEDLLETLGHEVIGIYPNGEEALGADIQHAELAVVDINLGSGMDGIQLATELRRRHGVPLVFCSAYSDEATRKRIGQMLPGAPVVGKPVSSRDLEEAIAFAVTAKH